MRISTEGKKRNDQSMIPMQEACVRSGAVLSIIILVVWAFFIADQDPCTGSWTARSEYQCFNKALIGYFGDQRIHSSYYKDWGRVDAIVIVPVVWIDNNGTIYEQRFGWDTQRHLLYPITTGVVWRTYT